MLLSPQTHTLCIRRVPQQGVQRRTPWPEMEVREFTAPRKCNKAVISGNMSQVWVLPCHIKLILLCTYLFTEGSQSTFNNPLSHTIPVTLLSNMLFSLRDLPKVALWVRHRAGNRIQKWNPNPTEVNGSFSTSVGQGFHPRCPESQSRSHYFLILYLSLCWKRNPLS